MRNKFYKAEGRYPERILINEDVADRIKKELADEIGVEPEKLFGMQIEIVGEEISKTP